MATSTSTKSAVVGDNRLKEERVDRRPKRKKPGFHEEMFEETKYYFKNGLRYVYPYPFTFTAHIKKRWLDLKLIELFEREFHMETVEYYENAIKIGKVRVNDQIVSRDHVLTGQDILKTIAHRHEPPVVHEEIEFLQNDDNMVVINKPASIPVHPCGRYRHNTIVFILGKEHTLGRLHTIHRIDRLTSGILMFARNAQKAKEMEANLHGRNVEKEYFARVVGDFPEGEVVVDEPLLTMSHKIGVCQVHTDGKACSTTFNKIAYNGCSSLVRCKPHTGRMHQIRVHLQWLSHPIVNDPIYNHKTAWGKEKGKKGTQIDVKQVVAELIRTRKDKLYDDDNVGVSNDDETNVFLPNNKTDNDGGSNSCGENACKKLKMDNTDSVKSSVMECTSKSTEEGPSILEDKFSKPVSENLELERNQESGTKENFEGRPIVDEDDSTLNQEQSELYEEHKARMKERKEEEEEEGSYTSLDLGEEYHDPTCTECKHAWKIPKKSELIMYLHAHSYKGPGWEYKTTLPDWAKETWRRD